MLDKSNFIPSSCNWKLIGLNFRFLHTGESELTSDIKHSEVEASEGELDLYDARGAHSGA